MSDAKVNNNLTSVVNRFTLHIELRQEIQRGHIQNESGKDEMRVNNEMVDVLNKVSQDR